MHIRRLVAVAALLAFATPDVAPAQTAANADARLARLDPAVRAAVVAIVDSARVSGLPAEPLVDKALEGISKGAPGPRVVIAVRGLAGKLSIARQALGEAPDEALVAGADALRAGASHLTLAELRTRRPPDRLAVPLSVLTDLVARGVPVDTAAAIVLALAPNASDDEYVALRRAVERDVNGGIPPSTSVAARGNAAIAAGPPLRPAGPVGVGLTGAPGTTDGVASRRPTSNNKP